MKAKRTVVQPTAPRPLGSAAGGGLSAGSWWWSWFESDGSSILTSRTRPDAVGSTRRRTATYRPPGPPALLARVGERTRLWNGGATAGPRVCPYPPPWLTRLPQRRSSATSPAATTSQTRSVRTARTPIPSGRPSGQSVVVGVAPLTPPSFAVFICLQCAGVHRGFGVHIR